MSTNIVDGYPIYPACECYQSYTQKGGCNAGDYAQSASGSSDDLTYKCCQVNPNICQGTVCNGAGCPAAGQSCNNQCLQNYCTLNPLANAFVSTKWQTAGRTDPSTEIWSMLPTNLVCSYDATKITTLDQYNAWVTNYGTNTSDYNNMMSYFCAVQETTGCLNGAAACSRITSQSTEGQICQNWCQTSQEACSSAMSNYCNAHNTADCGCVNRTQNASYQAIVSGLGEPLPPACWYLPCTGSFPGTQYLIQIDDYNQRNSCPQNVCQQITNAINNTNTTISIRELQQVTSCPTNSSGSVWGQYKWWIIGFLIVVGIFLVILILVGIFAYEHHHHTAEKKEEMSSTIPVSVPLTEPVN